MPAALALLAAFFFGAALVTTQYGLRHMDGVAGARVSVPSAALLLWLLVPWRGLDGWQPQAAATFLALGLFFPVAVTFLAYEANRRMGPTIAGAIGSTAPLFAVLGAVLFLGEALMPQQMGATLAIVAGSVVLVWRRGTRMQGAAWTSWVSWAAAALRALAQVIAKAGMLLWSNPFAAALLCYSVSAVMVFAVTSLGRHARPRAYNRRGVFWFWLTGVCNCLAVLTLYSALERGEVKIVSPIAASYPLFTLVLIGVILRQEHLGARLVVGVLLLVGGVAILLTA
jgi:drug/metabolite transporter (DMT)-like permease